MAEPNILAAEAEAFMRANPDVTHLDPLLIDLCGNALGKRYPAAQIEKFYRSGTTFCASTYLLDVTGNSADPLGYGFSDGDPDADGWPVPGTLKRVPWSGGTGAQCLLTLRDRDGSSPLWFEPRVILRQVADRLAADGLTPVIAVELEFHLLDRERDAEGRPQPPLNPRSGERNWAGKVYGLDMLDDFAPVLEAISQACKTQDIPASTALSEYGAGQFEINLEHVDDPIKAADDAALLRRAVQGAARDAGYDATFLSKPYTDLAGSGMHVHVSLFDRDGRNIFDSAHDGGEEALGHAVAGLQAALAQSFGILAPNINAFRRFKPDLFVPVTADWADNNRSVAFRVPQSDGANRRIEHRVAGAEANPYLVVAAVLAGIHHGLANKLEPAAKATGNAGAEIDESLPLTPWQALDAVETGDILKDYFGADYPKLYAAVKRAEFRDFLTEISAREYEWYL